MFSGNILRGVKTQHTTLVKLSVVFPQTVIRLEARRLCPICGKSSVLEVKDLLSN